jgi:hypothetical protein
LLEKAVSSQTLFYDFLSATIPRVAFRDALARPYLAAGEDAKAVDVLDRDREQRTRSALRSRDPHPLVAHARKAEAPDGRPSRWPSIPAAILDHW